MSAATGRCASAAGPRQGSPITAAVEVRIKKRVKRHGRVEEMGELAIQFGSMDELNGLIDRLRGG
jgi:ParB family transcriptional regulator, chromosome partitioning protein